MAKVKLDFSQLPLSERESEILLLAADGLTDRQISDKIGIGEGTIRTYWDRTRHKLGAKSRGEAIAKSLREAYEAAIQELAESQAWQRIMVECSEDYAIFRTDAEGTILTWNPGVARLLYYAEDEFVGKSIDIIYTEADRAAGVPAQERKIAAETGRHKDSGWHIRKDGAKIWIEDTLVALFDGVLLGFAKIMQDRTQEWQAKQEVVRLSALEATEKGIEQDPDPMPD